MKNLNTIKNRVLSATAYKEMLTGSTSNAYIGISRPLTWDLNVAPQPTETTSDLNSAMLDMIALKRTTASDMSLVIPRVDWKSNTIYSEYTETLDLYAYNSYSPLTGTANANVSSNLIIGTGTNFTSNLSVGDFVTMYGDSNTSPLVTKEVVSITSNVQLVVNSVFSANYSSNSIYKNQGSYPKFANSFYVRNTRDQVFKCLYNKFSAYSTSMPEITIDGQLPENPYIETGDGYKWKYMYTIPSGVKEKFFTKDWMPVLSETAVVTNAVDGRLDIIKIINGGAGYQANGSCTSANIITVVGDGVSANLTANVVNGVIDKIHVLNGGSGYTNAIITITDTGTSNANIVAVIGPQNGHGSNSAYELGATNLMISVNLDADENGTIPTTTNLDAFDYRQVMIMRNPKSSVDGSYLNNINYTTTYIARIASPPANSNFRLDETVYQGSSLATATFSGIVVNWRTTDNELWLTNVQGTFANSTPIKGTVQLNAVTAFTLSPPAYRLYSGETLYIENRLPIVRSPYQTEQIKLVLSF
jgi:hypothetical protein